MKKNIVYVLILLLLAVAVVLIHRSKQEAKKATTDMDFTVAKVDEVERIVISDERATADLRREADHWKINGKYRVMPAKMDVLLETISRIAVHAPVSNIRRELVMKDFEAGATKVEIYRKGESKPFKVYYVDGNTEDSKGTYMLMEIDGKKAQKPHVMVIPGFVGILNVRYFTDETEWRDTNIFDYSFGDIKQVSVSYPADPENSFYINMISQDSFAVYRHGQPEPTPSGEIYKEGVVKYLSSFDFLNAEAFDNSNPKKDSIVNAVPYVSIAITEKTNFSKQMVVFRMPLGKRSKSQFDQAGGRLPFDLDRYYASINGGKDFVIIQDFVFGKVFRKYADFLLTGNR